MSEEIGQERSQKKQFNPQLTGGGQALSRNISKLKAQPQKAVNLGGDLERLIMGSAKAYASKEQQNLAYSQDAAKRIMMDKSVDYKLGLNNIMNNPDTDVYEKKTQLAQYSQKHTADIVDNLGVEDEVMQNAYNDIYSRQSRQYFSNSMGKLDVAIKKSDLNHLENGLNSYLSTVGDTASMKDVRDNYSLLVDNGVMTHDELELKVLESKKNVMTDIANENGIITDVNLADTYNGFIKKATFDTKAQKLSYEFNDNISDAAKRIITYDINSGLGVIQKRKDDAEKEYYDEITDKAKHYTSREGYDESKFNIEVKPYLNELDRETYEFKLDSGKLQQFDILKTQMDLARDDVFGFSAQGPEAIKMIKPRQKFVFDNALSSLWSSKDPVKKRSLLNNIEKMIDSVPYMNEYIGKTIGKDFQTIGADSIQKARSNREVFTNKAIISTVANSLKGKRLDNFLMVSAFVFNDELPPSEQQLDKMLKKDASLVLDSSELEQFENIADEDLKASYLRVAQGYKYAGISSSGLLESVEAISLTKDGFAMTDLYKGRAGTRPRMVGKKFKIVSNQEIDTFLKFKYSSSDTMTDDVQKEYSKMIKRLPKNLQESASNNGIALTGGKNGVVKLYINLSDSDVDNFIFVNSTNLNYNIKDN